jgi:hypothetical protein
VIVAAGVSIDHAYRDRSIALGVQVGDRPAGLPGGGQVVLDDHKSARASRRIRPMDRSRRA